MSTVMDMLQWLVCRIYMPMWPLLIPQWVLKSILGQFSEITTEAEVGDLRQAAIVHSRLVELWISLRVEVECMWLL